MLAALTPVSYVITATGAAQGQTFELPGYRVQCVPLTGTAGNSGPILLISSKENGSDRTAQLTIRNLTERVTAIISPTKDRLVLVGELWQRGGQVLTLLDLEKGAVIDTVWAYDVSFSRDRRFAAYQFRYPPHGLPQFRYSVLLLYDFLAPDANPRVLGDDSKKGFILYPTENRLKRLYQIASPGQCCDGGPSTLVERVFTSPITWNPRGTELAVADAEITPQAHGETYLNVVNISDGPAQATVRRIKLDTVLFRKEAYASSSDPQRSPLLTVKIEFTPDDRTVDVISQDNGPFAARTVAVSLPDGKQEVIGSRK